MSNKDTFKFIEYFLNSDGISGFEYDISKKYIDYAKKYNVEIQRDGFGSVIAKIGNKGPKLMIVAHMDEVGFVVQSIDKDGFIKISPVGGFWVHTILSMPVKVITHDGKEYKGVIGSTSPHVLQPEQRTKVMKMSDVYVDIGVKSYDEVIKLGINVGDQIVRESKAFLMANDSFYCAKAIDNRISVAILAKLIEKINNEKLNAQIYLVASAQEEVGLRGAKASTQKINPDIAIAIDTTVSHDTPGIIPGDTKLGNGIAITMKDNSAIANPKLANYIYNLAKEKKIPVYKYVSQGGGNDSGVTQYSKSGIPVLTMAIPTRYLHTPYEVGSIVDFNATLDTIFEFIKKLDDNLINEFKY